MCVIPILGWQREGREEEWERGFRDSLGYKVKNPVKREWGRRKKI